MISRQLIEILNLCDEHDFLISGEVLAAFSLYDCMDLQKLLNNYYKCPKENKDAYFEVMTDICFMKYYDYEAILDIVAKTNPGCLDELLEILRQDNITDLPQLVEYLEIYSLLSNRPEAVYDDLVFEEILHLVPDAAYKRNPVIVKELLINQIKNNYDYYIATAETIYIEDDEKLTRKLNNYFTFRKIEKERDPQDIIRLVRKAKFTSNPNPSNIVYLDNFKKD